MHIHFKITFVWLFGDVAFVNISAVLLPHLNILHNVLKQKETKRRKSTVIYWIEQIILQTRLFLWAIFFQDALLSSQFAQDLVIQDAHTF